MIVTNIHDLQATDWQLGLSGFSEVVTDIDDVAQCIRVILLTKKGEDPLRPLFGCGLHEYIDKPLSQVGPALIREISEAIGLWERRIKVVSIEPVYSEAGLTIQLTGIYLRTGQKKRFTVPVYTAIPIGSGFSPGFDDGFS